MKIEPGCIPCIVNQAYISSLIFGITDPIIQKRIINETMSSLLNFNYDLSSPYFSEILQSILTRYSGNGDPYKKLKNENYEKVNRYIPSLEMMIERAENKLEMAVRLAIIGNTIDLGANPNFDLEKDIDRINTHINMNHFQFFEEDLKKSNTILYVADNFEEAIFDKFLIKLLYPRNIIFAVRSGEVLNDITIEGAKRLGIDGFCSIIESGSKIAGTDINNLTFEFKEYFENADMIISKGQGNYETLSDINRPVYFLFKIKCKVISEKTGFPNGTGVLFKNIL